MQSHLPTVLKRNPLAILLLVLASIAMVLISEDSNQRATSLVQRLSAIAENSVCWRTYRLSNCHDE